MTYAWHPPVGANRYLPEGTVVARPVLRGGCWAATTYGGTQPRQCRAKARAKCLTCQAHREREDAAKALRDGGGEYA